MRGSNAPLWIVLTMLVLQIVSVLGQDFIHERIFGITDTGPIANAFDKGEEGKRALRGLLNYYQDMEQVMRRQKAEMDMYPLAINFIPLLVEMYGWPAIAKTQQVYRSHGGHDTEVEARERSVFEDITAFSSNLEKTGTFVRKNTLLKWKKFYSTGKLTRNTDTHACSMRTSTAFRIRGKWSIIAVLTNDESSVTKAEFERMYVSEQLRIGESGLVQFEPRLMNLTFRSSSSKYWNGASLDRTGERQTVSSTLALWGGKPGVNQFNTGIFEDNIAYLATLHKSKYLTRQSQDSTTVSNTAILMLPILIAAFPLALFADVEYMMTFVYMILTDVVTVMPLAVKGIELIVAGESKYFATRTMVYGNVAESSTVVAETWSVKCNSSQNLTSVGIAFLSVALLAMCAGIFLEVWTKRKVATLKNVQTRDNNEVSWTRSVPCLECRCYVEHCPTSGRTYGEGLLGQMQRRNARKDPPIQQTFMEY